MKTIANIKCFPTSQMGDQMTSDPTSGPIPIAAEVWAISQVLVPIHKLLDLQAHLYFPRPCLSCERSEPRLSDTHPSEQSEPRTCGSEARLA